VDETHSDHSGREAPAKHPARDTTRAPQSPRELLKLLGFSSLRRLVLVLVIEVVVAWFALALAVALVSDNLPVATLSQRFQVLSLSRPTTLVSLFVVAAAVVVPTFVWFHVSLLWVRVLWRQWRDTQAGRRSVEGLPPL